MSEPRPQGATEAVLHAATGNDLCDIAALHIACFRDRFMGFLGVPYLRRFYGFMLRDGESIVLAACASGRVIGYVAGVTNRQDYYTRFLRGCAWRVMGDILRTTCRKPGRLPQIWRLFRRSRQRPGYSEAAFLLALAVHPDWRRQGVAARLLEAFGDQLRARGVRGYALTTEASENEATNLFYLRQGFELVQTFSPPGREGLVNEYRLVL